jgi:hypothetical protein
MSEDALADFIQPIIAQATRQKQTSECATPLSAGCPEIVPRGNCRCESHEYADAIVFALPDSASSWQLESGLRETPSHSFGHLALGRSRRIGRVRSLSSDQYLVRVGWSYELPIRGGK